jgi:hypothetical protein
MTITLGKKYVVDGYVEDGYVEVILVEPLRTYTMFGKTTRVFPFHPNWTSPVSEGLEWKTDILRARDGSEQRRSLRMEPRRSFEYNILLQRSLTADFEAMLRGWQNRYFALPVWTDRAKLTADAPGLSTTISVNTDTIGFQSAGFALIYHSEKVFEVVEIDSVGTNTLTLSEPTGWDWPAGVLVYPLIVGHFNVTLPTSRETSAVLQAVVSFVGSADTAYQNLPVDDPATLYDGIEVITAKPNWRSSIGNEFSFEFDTVDAGVGPLGYFETESVARVVRPFQWFLKSREQIVEFRKLAARLRGQAKSVWMPSWHDDFTVAASNVGNQASLVVAGTWFNTLVGVDTSFDRLSIKLPNGTTVYRRITACVPDYSDDTTTLTLDSTLGTTVQPNDGSVVRLLLRCRLATDKIVIPWITDAVAEPQTSFITVKI